MSIYIVPIAPISLAFLLGSLFFSCNVNENGEAPESEGSQNEKIVESENTSSGSTKNTDEITNPTNESLPISCQVGQKQIMSLFVYSSVNSQLGPEVPDGNCWTLTNAFFYASKQEKEKNCADSNGDLVWGEIKYDPGFAECNKNGDVFYSTITQSGICCRATEDESPIIDPPIIVDENKQEACEYHMGKKSEGISAFFMAGNGYGEDCEKAKMKAGLLLDEIINKRQLECNQAGGTFKTIPAVNSDMCSVGELKNKYFKYTIEKGMSAICCRIPESETPTPVPVPEPEPEPEPTVGTCSVNSLVGIGFNTRERISEEICLGAGMIWTPDYAGLNLGHCGQAYQRASCTEYYATTVLNGLEVDVIPISSSLCPDTAIFEAATATTETACSVVISQFPQFEINWIPN